MRTLVRLLPVLLALLALLAAGCRYAGPVTYMRDCDNCDSRNDGDVEAQQGQKIPLDLKGLPGFGGS